MGKAGNADREVGASPARSPRSSPFRRIAVYLALLAAFTASCWFLMIRMPLQSHREPWTPLTGEEAATRDVLRKHVQVLAGDIGDRNLFNYENYLAAADYIESELRGHGFEVNRHEFAARGLTCRNIEVEIPGAGRAGEIVVIGAHYDSVPGSPAANDNGSGVAALLHLAGEFRGSRPERTLRFVAFANEEPPFFQTPEMGSFIYAGRAREKEEDIVAMMSLETIGYYTDEPGSQRYPFPFRLFYPDTGNFVAFVGNLASRDLVRRSIRVFRSEAAFPSEGAAIPSGVPGVGWSDHWSFWQHGYPAFMVTDTALFRDPRYHTAADTPDQLVYDRMARVVGGLREVVDALANPQGGEGP